MSLAELTDQKCLKQIFERKKVDDQLLVEPARFGYVE